MPTPTFETLKKFFETAEAARKATKPLKDGAEVAVQLDGGPATFAVRDGRVHLSEGQSQRPDFTLFLPDAAVQRVTSLKSDDVGEFGVEFFKLVLEKDPTLKVRVKIDASTGQLLSHGYLSVLALGGLKVTWWLLKNGVKNPKAAIDRLRGSK
jgi:hypothetical protein